MSGADNTATITISQIMKGDAVRQATADLEHLSLTMSVLRGIQNLFSGEVSDLAQNYTFASAGANSYNSGLGSLAATLGLTSAAQDEGNASLLQMLGWIGQIITPLEIAGQAVMNFGEQLLQMAGSEAWQLLQEGTQTIENLVEQVGQLNIQTQKTQQPWQFLFGGQQNSQMLSQWSAVESYNLPYTRQDEMSAITTLGRLNLTPKQIEQYIPLLADLGTLNPNESLTGLAQIVQGADEGYTRMLRYDLGINPQDLRQYGLAINSRGQITDKSTFLPALEAYAKARGISGSAQNTAQNTFWGLESSIVDRLQNFGLAVGGTNINGTIQKGGMFGQMIADLKELASWWDSHQGMLNSIATFLDKILSGGMNLGSTFLGGLFDSLNAQGTGNSILHGIEQLTKFINDPATQQGIDHIGLVVGDVLGPGFQTIGTVIGAIMSALGSNAGEGNNALDALTAFGQWLGNPQTQQGIATFAATLTGLATGGGEFVLQALTGFFQGVFQQGESSGGFKNFNDMLQQLVKTLNDPNFQAGVHEMAVVIGETLVNAWLTLYNAIKLVIDTVRDGAAVIGDTMTYLSDLSQFGPTSPVTQAAWNNMQNAGSQFGKDTGQDMQNLQNAIQQLTQAIQNLPGAIQDITNQAQTPGPTVINGHHVPVGVHSNYDSALALLMGGGGGGGFGGLGGDWFFGNGYQQSPYQIGQSFVDEFQRGAQQRLSSRTSPLAQSLSALMQETAQAVVNDALDRLDVGVMADARQVGGFRQFGAIGSALGGL